MLVKEAVSIASKYSSVAIIGGGIGGLSAANALLHRSGVAGRVTVYERAECFHPTAGAGFGLSPNGQICLSSIGINEYRTFVQPFDTMKRITKDGVTVEQESQVLKILRERHGFGIAGCLRADLVDTLVEKLEEKNMGNLAYSHKLTEIRPHLDKVELGFENGHQDLVDIVIGADGINSSVAKLMNIDDDTPPIYSGANIFYGKIPHPENHPIFDHRSVVNGPGTGEFICFHVGAGDKRTMIWANTYSSENAPPKRDDWNEGNKEELSRILTKFPDCHPIHELAKVTNDGDLLHFGLYFRHHKKSWSNDRVVLLGDACHATLPYVGQGANQAIEDAIYLADCLDRHGDYVSAYHDYYNRRFPRTKRIVQIAGLMHNLYHSENWFVQKALDVLLRNVIKGGAILKQMEKEIINECPVKNYGQYAP